MKEALPFYKQLLLDVFTMKKIFHYKHPPKYPISYFFKRQKNHEKRYHSPEYSKQNNM